MKLRNKKILIVFSNFRYEHTHRFRYENYIYSILRFSFCQLPRDGVLFTYLIKTVSNIWQMVHARIILATFPTKLPAKELRIINQVPRAALYVYAVLVAGITGI